jgi:gluconolactonase
MEIPMTANPLDGFRVDQSMIEFIGHDLQRPECILAERDGTLWSADARGGVVRIRPNGSQEIITQKSATAFAKAIDDEQRFTQGTLPNGLAFDRDGNFLIANFGTDCLEVMTRQGESRTIVDSIDGKPIGKVNFVLRDSRDRIWITVSTRIKNWMMAMRPDIADGYIALYDSKGLRVVADGLAFANEIRLDASEAWMYAVETTGQRVTRFRVGADGSLADREVFGPTKLGLGGFPDGIAFDAFGNLWGTLVMADIIFAITPDGAYREIFNDGDADITRRMDARFHAGTLTAHQMLQWGGTLASWFASVTFGGVDLRTAYIGSLRGNRIPHFRSPVPGLPMAHW